jgi:hypothetical protein
MGHLIKVEQFGQGNNLEDSREFSVPSWQGIWDAVEDEMDRTGKIPTGMEGWDESGCALTEGHDCDEQPEQCQRHLKNAIREWIRSAWEYDELKTGSFCFGGAEWSSITFGWDGN